MWWRGWTVANFAADTIDLAGPTVWPITSPTYILLPTNPAADKVAGSRAAMRFFDWAYKNGADAARRLEYIPIPDAVQNAVRATWTQVKDPSGAEVWSA